MDGGEIDVIARTTADILLALAIAGVAGIGAGAGFVMMTSIRDRWRRRPPNGNGDRPPG